MTDADIKELEKALTKKREPKPEKKSRQGKKAGGDKPAFVPVDKSGNEVNPKDIETGKMYGLKDGRNNKDF